MESTPQRKPGGSFFGPILKDTLLTSSSRHLVAPTRAETPLKSIPQVNAQGDILDVLRIRKTRSAITSVTSAPIPATTLSPTFHPFSRLAIELRRQIWQLALPAPIVVPLECRIWEGAPDFNYFGDRFRESSCFNDGRGWKRSTTLLRACFESNEVYLQEFPHALPFSPVGRIYDGQVLRFGDNDAVYFYNLENQFYKRAFWRILKKSPWVKELRTLWVHEDIIFFHDMKKWVALLKHFTGLELVVGVEAGEDKDRTRIGIWVKELRDKLVAANVKGLKVPAMTFKDNDVERAYLQRYQEYLDDRMLYQLQCL